MPKALGPIDKAVRARLDAFQKDGLAAKIWAKDPSAWSQKDPAALRSIQTRLGWLASPEAMKAACGEMKSFAAGLAASGFKNAILLGMGGSSLAPEVFERTFGAAPGALRLGVLDSTDPASVAEADRTFDPRSTVLLVSSKSGGTIEVNSFYRHFAAKTGGSSFAAITDPDTQLEQMAEDAGFRKIFLNDPNIGGRYSALSYFGLVPAALLGVDIEKILASAAAMAAACSPSADAASNPGLWLGAVLGEAAVAGRDKLTLFVSPELASLGSWIEQLVAESTGKEGRGILPVDGEGPGPSSVYGRDRLFVHIRLAASRDRSLDEKLAALESAGHPVLRLEVPDLHALGAEFFRWEFATAAAGAVLGINPFDEPNVKESKDLTAEALAAFEKSGALPEPKLLSEQDGLRFYADPAIEAAGAKGPREGLEAHLGRARQGDYAALLAYLHPEPAVRAELEALRMALRDRLKLATTLGFGPRFLHSTGQLHKGGPNSGLFIQITCDDRADLPIPGQKYGFSVLKGAQALGDMKALQRHGRRVVRCRLGADPVQGLKALSAALGARPIGAR